MARGLQYLGSSHVSTSDSAVVQVTLGLELIKDAKQARLTIREAYLAAGILQ